MGQGGPTLRYVGMLLVVGSALISGCSVEPAANLYNQSGSALAIRVAAFEQGRVVGRKDLPVAPGGHVRVGASELQAAGLAVVAGRCIYAYRLTSDDLETISDQGAGSYPIALDVRADMSLHLRPSSKLPAPRPGAFGFPRNVISKTCSAA